MCLWNKIKVSKTFYFWIELLSETLRNHYSAHFEMFLQNLKLFIPLIEKFGL